MRLGGRVSMSASGGRREAVGVRGVTFGVGAAAAVYISQATNTV